MTTVDEGFRFEHAPMAKDRAAGWSYVRAAAT